MKSKSGFFKTSLLFVSLLLLVSLIAFPKQIILRSFEWKIRNAVQKKLGANLEYEWFGYSSGKFSMEKVEIEKGEHFAISLSSIIVTPKIHWRKRAIFCEVELCGLKILHQTHEPIEFKGSKLPFFHLVLSAKFDDADLFLQGEGDVSHHAKLSLVHESFDKKGFGTLFIDWQSQSPLFQIPYSFSEERGLCATASLAGHAAEEILPCLDHAFPRLHLREQVVAKRGIIHGSIDIEKGAIQTVLAIQDFVCTLPQLHSDFEAKSGQVDLHCEETVTLGHIACEEAGLFFGQKRDERYSLQNLAVSIDCKEQTQLIEVEGEFIGLSGSLFCTRRAGVIDGYLKLADGREEYRARFGYLGEQGSDLPPFAQLFAPLCEGELEQEHLAALCEESAHGWVRASDVFLERFFSTYLLRDCQLKVMGTANMEAYFDGSGIYLFYETRDLTLDSPAFCLQTEGASEHGVYFLDFDQKRGRGHMHLVGASYHQKKLGVSFEDASAHVHFEGAHIALREINAYFEDLHFKGSIDLIAHSVNDVGLTIEAHGVEGPLSDAKNLLAHIHPSYFWDLPIQGMVFADEDAMRIRYHFSPRANLVEAKVQGGLIATAKTPLFTVEDYTTSFVYDYSASELLFTGGEGLFDMPLVEKRYQLHVPSLRFALAPEINLEGSLNMSEEGEVVLAVQGHSETLCSVERHICAEGEGFGMPIRLHGSETLGHFLMQEVSCGPLLATVDVEWQDPLFCVNKLSLIHEEWGTLSFVGKLNQKLQSAQGIFEHLELRRSSPHLVAFLNKFGVELFENNVCTQVGLDCSLSEVKLFKELNVHEQPLHVEARLRAPQMDRLTLSFAEEGEPLCFLFGKKKGWKLQEVQGELCGIRSNLMALHGNLFGTLACNIAQALPLFPPVWREKIEKKGWHGSYELEGRFGWPNRAFSGHIACFDAGMLGMHIDEGSAHISLDENHVDLEQCQLTLGQAKFALHTSRFEKKEGEWTFEIDELAIKDLHPAGLFAQIDKKQGRSFCMHDFSLRDVHGMLLDPSSYQGHGFLNFTNLPKRTFLSTLLYLPTELTARLGLDFSALVPAYGTIHYDIQGGKIFCRDFDQMYSQGRRSKFYLAENSEASIDFDGNLNLQVKMKQYNLLMKLAEFFTITIKGTLANPTYSFALQTEESDAPAPL